MILYVTILYRSCWFGHKFLVTGFFFGTALGNQFLCTGQSRVTYSISEGRLAYNEKWDETAELQSDSEEEWYDF